MNNGSQAANQRSSASSFSAPQHHGFDLPFEDLADTARGELVHEFDQFRNFIRRHLFLQVLNDDGLLCLTLFNARLENDRTGNAFGTGAIGIGKADRGRQ
jgi:hypothetical protein